jgi:hypothetical protein
MLREYSLVLNLYDIYLDINDDDGDGNNNDEFK